MPPKILTPVQEEFLHAFFAGAAGQQFFLTGGTALAEFYLHHRFSEDIDLFTLDEEAFQSIGPSLPVIAADLGTGFSERIATLTFRQIFLRPANEP